MMNFKHDMLKPIQLKVERSLSKSGEVEKLTSSYSAGKVILRSQDENALLFGKNQLEIALKSGHIREYLGESSPRFSIRPLWIKKELSLDKNICERILEYGFNTIITDVQTIDLPVLKDAGLNVMVPLKLDLEGLCFFDEVYQIELQKKISELDSADYIFWEGTFQSKLVKSHTEGEDLLEEETALFEVQLLERNLPKGVSLVYCLPTTDDKDAQRQSEWFPDFCDDVSGKTIVAFSSVAGDPTQDHLTLHPFWERLRLMLDPCSTQLLPLLNVGSINQGGGFWPQFPFDTISEVLSRCTDHNFAGLISLVNRLPNKGAFLDGTLWVTAQMLWKENSSNKLAETWFAAQRPELNYKRYQKDIENVRSISLELNRLKELNVGAVSHEECREIAESTMSQLRKLHTSFMYKKNEVGLGFSDYYTYFARDAAKVLLFFLKKQNIPMSSLFRTEELQESFWTEMKEGNRSEVFLLDEPNAGEQGSVMNQIYQEVYGL